MNSTLNNTFEETLKFIKVAFLLSGIEIEQNENKFRKYFKGFIFFFNLLWLYGDVFGEFFWLIEGIQVGKSFGDLSLIAPCFTICLVSTAKGAPLFYHRQLLVEVIGKLRSMHPKFEETESFKEPVVQINDKNRFNEEKQTNAIYTIETEKKIVKDSAKFLNLVIRLLYYSFVVVVVAFTLLPLSSMAYDYHKSGHTELKLPFFVKYFFDPFTKTRWPFVYFHQVWSKQIFRSTLCGAWNILLYLFLPFLALLVCFNMFSADTFLYMFCTYIHMHFSILSHRFEFVVTSSLSETKCRLNELVKFHQTLIKLVDQVEIMTSNATLFNIVTSSVLICLSGFNITFIDDSTAVIAFITFLMMSISQISLLCYFGDLLMRSSTKVREAVYKSRWYDADSSVKKSMIIIIIRSQKPCRLTAAKFAVLNLSAFTTILSRSWSYFALLKTVYK